MKAEQKETSGDLKLGLLQNVFTEDLKVDADNKPAKNTHSSCSFYLENFVDKKNDQAGISITRMPGPEHPNVLTDFLIQVDIEDFLLDEVWASQGSITVHTNSFAELRPVVLAALKIFGCRKFMPEVKSTGVPIDPLDDWEKSAVRNARIATSVILGWVFLHILLLI